MQCIPLFVSLRAQAHVLFFVISRSTVAVNNYMEAAALLSQTVVGERVAQIVEAMSSNRYHRLLVPTIHRCCEVSWE